MVSILGNYCFYFPKPHPLTKRMVDYLEDSVDEKYYIDNEKSSALIKKLTDDGTLPIEREGFDLSINDPQRRTIANCISARTDRGISNRKAEGTGVIEYTSYSKL